MHTSAFMRTTREECFRYRRGLRAASTSDGDASARTTSDANGRNARKHIADVFTVGNEREQALRLSAQTRTFTFG